MRRLLAAAVVVAVSFGSTSPALAQTYPADGPNDPDYAPVERGSFPSICTQMNVNQEAHYLYSFEPQCAPNASDPNGAAGMSADKAWSTYTIGDPSVVLAYIEGGINWFDSGARDLVNRVWLNRGELPQPRDSGGTTHATYDLNADGTFNAKDYADDARCGDRNGNDFLDPEDLIVCFSNHTDSDHNGFVDDISGWDFYDHQNDPATYDSTYGHANNQMYQAGAEGNNNRGGVGVCPGCMILPIKAGAEALDRTDDLAQAWLYAGHMGAKVIISVTADLGYSSYMRQAVDKLWHDGVVMVQASNDFDSLDHQGGMFWPHVLPGNGLVSNTQGFDLASSPPTNPAINLATRTFSQRSGLTSWGTHNMFSAATQGGSTSESTPTVGGAFGLLLSYGRLASQQGHITGALTNAEAIQVMRTAADDIVGDPNLPGGWIGKPGWDLQYGYGRINLFAAMNEVKAGQVPPVAWFNGPDWYSLYDPTTTKAVTVTGHVAAPRSSSYHWTLEYGLGPEPTTWSPINSGNGSTAYDGTLGTLDLTKIPQSFWTKPFGLSQTKTLETNDQYTVSLRIRVYDAANRMGEERRAIAVHHDSTLVPGFPVKFSADSSPQPVLADLQGRGRLAMVFADADGAVHAIDPVTRTELPGWPAYTRATVPDHDYPGIDPGHEPVLSPVTIGDLTHTGRLNVIATSTTGRTYVWDASGRLQAGWPKTLDTSAVTPAIPRPRLNYTRLAHLGATSSPVLVDLDGDQTLEITQAAWDGNLYAWHANSATVSGWPARVRSTGLTPPPNYVLINDQKLDLTPAVADLDGDGAPEMVVQSQYTFTRSGGIQPFGFGHAFAFHADGSPVDGWPNSEISIIVYYGSAQEFITEGTTEPATADVDGDGDDEVAVTGGIFTPTFLYDGDGSLRTVYGPVPNPATQILEGNFSLSEILSGNLPADVPLTFTTSGAFGRFGLLPGLGFAQAGSGGVSVAAALVLAGSGFAIKNYERGYDARTGAVAPGFPQQMQGLNFLGSPTIADVDGSGHNAVIDGADSSALHAFGATGGQVTGWPKFMTGWTVFSPSIGDARTTGHNDVVSTTREGYLMVWSTPGSAANNNEWWTYHHDEWRTGRYGADTRPPGTLRNPSWLPGRATATFAAPGDDWYVGSVASYHVVFGPSGDSLTVQPSGAAGSAQSFAVPVGTKTVTVQASDDVGNLGPAVELAAATRASGGAPGDSTLRNRPLATTGLGSFLPVLAVALLGAALVVRRRRTLN